MTSPNNKELLQQIAKGLASNHPDLGKRLAVSKVPIYGSFELDPEVATRRNPNKTVTYGRFDENASFVPFSLAEEKAFKKRFPHHFGRNSAKAPRKIKPTLSIIPNLPK